MEVKIVCACGTKFKFNVEPVHGRMPMPINCPTCGVDATDQANALLKSSLSSTAPQPLPAAAQPAPAGLRINRPVAPPPAPAAAGDETPAPLSSATARWLGSQPSQRKKSVLKILTTSLLLVCIAFGSWRFGVKWYKRLALVARVVSAVGKAGSEQDGSESDEGAKNLWYEDCSVLFIKHTNHLEVVSMCKDIWKTNLHKNLSLVKSTNDFMNPGEYELIPAHNGYVRIVGSHDWPEPEHEAIAQKLSKQLATLVFEWRSEHVADTYHFGVYDQGTRKFHAQMDVKVVNNDFEEIVTTQGNEFAIANGYKLGEEGFKEFNVLDADKITRQLGMKLWDEPEAMESRTMLLLKEAAPVAGRR